MICPNCHSEINDDAVFCSECGKKIEIVKEPQVEDISSVGSRVQNREKQKQGNNKKTMMIVGAVAAVVIIVAACYLLFFSQSDDKSEITTEETVEKETAIKLEESSLTLKVGETDYIEANIDCTYTVKDDSICEVDSFGTVKGLKAGKTTVTCKGDNGTKATCKITVEESDEAEETIAGDYVFPNSSTTLLTENDLTGKSEWELRIGINEIYARHHCTFKTQEIVDYFSSKSWYSADPNLTSDKMNENVSAYLNDIEVKNVNFIRTYQESH